MAKRLTEKEIKQILKFFISGETVEDLSTRFNCTKLTVSRNLKKNIGEKKFKELINEKKTSLKSYKKKGLSLDSEDNGSKTNFIEKDNINYENNLENKSDIYISHDTQFTEIVPLDCNIESSPQKDLSSVPIADVDFPKIVYMIVHKNIELEIKKLNDYPKWNFLSKEELNRKTIEIYTDQKEARRFCSKDQKVIKVPNTDVFKIVAPLLIARGISRIVSPDKLISL